jgi:hypothetical protein
MNKTDQINVALDTIESYESATKLLILNKNNPDAIVDICKAMDAINRSLRIILEES